MTKICGIVAVGPNMEIGASGRLLYPNQTDMAFFCGYTQNKLLVMGRKTAETIPVKMAGRDVICVSRNKDKAQFVSPCVNGFWDGEDVEVLKQYARGRDIVVVGGAEIYSLFAGKYDEFLVTTHNYSFDSTFGKADAFFDEKCLEDLHKRELVFNGRDVFNIYKFNR